MTCRELDQFLYPYLDGEFEAAERLEVEAHLAACGDCATRVHAERRFQEQLRARAKGAAASAAPELLRGAIRQGLKREQRRAAWVRAGRLTAAAALLAAFPAGYVLLQQQARHQSYIEDAAARHAMRFPLEIQQQSASQIEAWFAGKLRHRVSVPVLPNAIPAGARLLNVQEKQAAYISYDAESPAGRAPGRIGLFVYGDEAGDAPFAPQAEGAQIANSRGFNVVSWRDGDVVYQLVSDLDEADIRQMLRRDRPSGEARPRLEVQPASLQR